MPKLLIVNCQWVASIFLHPLTYTIYTFSDIYLHYCWLVWKNRFQCNIRPKAFPDMHEMRWKVNFEQNMSTIVCLSMIIIQPVGKLCLISKLTVSLDMGQLRISISIDSYFCCLQENVLGLKSSFSYTIMLA